MKQKRWVFYDTKLKNSPKTKQITKKKYPKVPSLQIPTFKFKSRKVPITHQQSLQNNHMKLQQIYQTCKKFQINYTIYILAVNIYKNVVKKNGLVYITSAQTLACLTMGIKFQQATNDKTIKLLQNIVKRSKINKNELSGAQIFILQYLSFKLPILSSLTPYNIHTHLQKLITNWNTYILTYHADKISHFVINNKADITNYQFQNYVNMRIMINYLFTFIIEKGKYMDGCLGLWEQQEDICKQGNQGNIDKQYILHLALQIVINQSYQILYIDNNIKAIFTQFINHNKQIPKHKHKYNHKLKQISDSKPNSQQQPQQPNHNTTKSAIQPCIHQQQQQKQFCLMQLVSPSIVNKCNKKLKQITIQNYAHVYKNIQYYASQTNNMDSTINMDNIVIHDQQDNRLCHQQDQDNYIVNIVNQEDYGINSKQVYKVGFFDILY